MKLERDWDGFYVCPLLVHEQGDWDESRDQATWSWQPCRSWLHVNQSFLGIFLDHERPEDALTSAWSVECENGHVLARSGAEENAEPFDFRAWMVSLEAEPVMT